MTTFVDTSVLLSGHEADDQAPVVVVVRSAMAMFREVMGEADANAFEAQFGEKYSKNDFCGIFDLLLGQSKYIFEKLSNEENQETANRIAKTVEGFFHVVLSVLSKLDSIEDVEQRVDNFLTVMQFDFDQKDIVAQVKFQLVVTLFNIFSPQTALRVKVVKALCRQPGAFELVADCDKWVDEFWDLSSEEKRELFGLVASVASNEEKIKYLTLQAQVDPSVPADALFQASIDLPSIVSFVHCEGLTTKDPKLSECVEILSKKSFKDMEAFVEKHNPTNKTALIAKMQAIAMSQMTGTVSIAAIGQTLKTDAPFDLVVRAIQLGVIRGAIDEVAGVVNITAALPRTQEELRKIQTSF